jgi:hypothetical protein
MLGRLRKWWKLRGEFVDHATWWCRNVATTLRYPPPATSSVTLESILDMEIREIASRICGYLEEDCFPPIRRSWFTDVLCIKLAGAGIPKRVWMPLVERITDEVCRIRDGD